MIHTLVKMTKFILQVEMRTWVNPKGWMLLGMGVALVAWSAIFFTLSGLGII